VAAGEREFELPVVDLSLLDGDEASKDELAAQVDRAFSEVGFVYVVGHGVSPGVIDEIFDVSERFFALPEELKAPIAQGPSGSQLRGYRPFGSPSITKKKSSNPHNEESKYWNAGFDAKFPEVEVGPFAANNQWPDEEVCGLPGFRSFIAHYRAEVHALGMRLLQVCARALDIPEDYSEPAFEQEDSRAVVTLNHFPPGPAPRLGFSAHTDPQMMTLLAQPRKKHLQQPGLEICLPDGRWVRPQVIPGAFIVNPGDLIRM